MCACLPHEGRKVGSQSQLRRKSMKDPRPKETKVFEDTSWGTVSRGAWGWKLLLRSFGGVRGAWRHSDGIVGSVEFIESDGINPLSVFVSCGYVEGYLACMATLFACKLCGRDDGLKKLMCWLRKVKRKPPAGSYMAVCGGVGFSSWLDLRRMSGRSLEPLQDWWKLRSFFYRYRFQELLFWFHLFWL